MFTEQQSSPAQLYNFHLWAFGVGESYQKGNYFCNLLNESEFQINIHKRISPIL